MSGRAATGDELLPFLKTGRVVRAGLVIVVLFFAGFVVWAAFAPLESAMIAPGVVIPASGRQAGTVAIGLRVAPENVDAVRTGMTAKVDLSANTVRRLPMLTGTVSYVSPQAVLDPRSGQIYFLARLTLDRATVAGFPAAMRPGMAVRVEIPTGAHTALEYLIEPITAVMHNGMREK